VIDWNNLAQALKYGDEAEMWKDLYGEKKMSVNVLSAKFGVGVNTVTKRLNACAVEIRKRGGGNYVRIPKEMIDELVKRVEAEGITAVAKSLTPPVDPSTLYKRLYYSRGKRRRVPEQVAEQGAVAQADPSAPDVPTENQ
jgi:NH3-dependent NAD+ synthetase